MLAKIYAIGKQALEVLGILCFYIDDYNISWSLPSISTRSDFNASRPKFQYNETEESNTQRRLRSAECDRNHRALTVRRIYKD
jgi:hypothetical protein